MTALSIGTYYWYDLIIIITVFWRNAGQGIGTVRLSRSGITSTSYSSGRVQIYYNSQWGNICDDIHFGLTEAHVICHQLGYTRASSQSRQYSDTYVQGN